MTSFLVGLTLWLVGIPVAGYLMECVEEDDGNKAFAILWPMLLPIGVLLWLGAWGVLVARGRRR